jgi:hypothetical protein
MVRSTWENPGKVKNVFGLPGAAAVRVKPMSGLTVHGSQTGGEPISARRAVRKAFSFADG